MAPVRRSQVDQGEQNDPAAQDDPAERDDHGHSESLPEWVQTALEPLKDAPPSDNPERCRILYMQHVLATTMRIRLQARAEQDAASALSTLACKDLEDAAAKITDSVQLFATHKE